MCKLKKQKNTISKKVMKNTIEYYGVYVKIIAKSIREDEKQNPTDYDDFAKRLYVKAIITLDELINKKGTKILHKIIRKRDPWWEFTEEALNLIISDIFEREYF